MATTNPENNDLKDKAPARIRVRNGAKLSFTIPEVRSIRVASDATNIRAVGDGGNPRGIKNPMSYRYDLPTLLRMARRRTWLYKPEWVVTDLKRNLCVYIHDAIPYAPDVKGQPYGVLRIRDNWGDRLEALAPLGATAPTRGAYVVVWRASKMYDYGELYGFVGVGIYVPTRPLDEGPKYVAEYDELIIRNDELPQFKDKITDELRDVLRYTIHDAWFMSAFREYHPNDELTPYNMPTLQTAQPISKGAE